MSNVRKSKKFFAVLLSALLVLTMLLPFAGMVTLANTGNAKGVDIVLVVDDTRSMKNTDPSKLSAVAIKKFVDLLEDGKDIKLGIATYSVELLPGALELGATKDQVKRFADTNLKQSGSGTDAAVGVDWAVNQLTTKSSNQRQRAIVLIGDGENDYRDAKGKAVRSDADSTTMLDAAITKATAEGIKVYTVAMGPESDTFRQYFKDIASRTSGLDKEPTSVAEVNTVMDEIFSHITNGIVVSANPVPLDPNVPVTEEFDVPDGVFEMNLQCDYQKPIEIYFNDPNGTLYNEASNNVTYTQEPTYSNFKISQPAAGKWTVTYRSDIKQTIVPKFVFHKNMGVNLAMNQSNVEVKQDVQYVATVSDQSGTIADQATLEGYAPVLVVTAMDDQGNPGKTYTEKMKVENGKIILEHAIKKAGKYEAYAELDVNGTKLKSNVLRFDVAPDPNPFWTWKTILIAALLALLIIGSIIFITVSRNKPGSGYIYGFVSVKIVGRLPNDETMVFQNDRFSCDQVFVKKNTLSDLINAYTKRYRINNSSELAELTLSQFINSTLSEVTDKVSICGNKKKQIIIRIPVGYEMEVDGMPVNKPRTISFNSPERAVELRFKNQGSAYTISMVFAKQ